jgi:uncharacterized protein (TIGR02996 family)
MTDLDALRLAVLANPDDDLPRLVYADCLEENGDPDRAAFIRAQMELAKQPEYEPFPIYCQTRRPEWVSGSPWLQELRNSLNSNVTFQPEPIFRRGFAWCIGLNSPRHTSAMQTVLNEQPIQAVHVRPGTLDQWVEFAASAWLPRIRSITFDGLTSPNEPLRALRNSPLSSGIRSIQLNHINVPSIPEILEALLATPLGRQLTTLNMRLGYGSADETIEAIANSGAAIIHDYNLERIGFGPSAMRVFVDGGLARQTAVLRLVGNPVMSSGLEILATATEQLRILDLSETFLDEVAANVLAQSGGFRAIRKLVLNGNPLGEEALKAIARSPNLTDLRSLGLAVTRCDNSSVRYLTRSTFWPNLVELDLTGNPISDAGAKHLLTARSTTEMTSLRLTARRLSETMQAELRGKFGEVVVFAE